MKRPIPLTICLLGMLTAFSLLPSVVSSQQWTPITVNLPYGINGLSFPTPDTGFFVSNRGQFGRSFNGGLKWEIFTIGDAILEDVHFRTTQLGYTCGRNGVVFFTTNAGRTWTKRAVPDTTCWLLSVYVCSANDIVVTGSIRGKNTSIGVCYYSSDGGARWKKAEVSGIKFGEITRVDNKTLSFLSWGQRHVSTDCGKTWVTTTTGNGRPGRIAMINGKTGIMVGNEGWGAVSQNGGQTWDSVKMNTDADLTCMVMPSAKRAFVGGMFGTMLSTVDGGLSWTKEELPSKFDVFDIEQAGGYLIASGSAAFGGREGKLIRRKLSK